jgi:hypothetical protein
MRQSFFTVVFDTGESFTFIKDVEDEFPMHLEDHTPFGDPYAAGIIGALVSSDDWFSYAWSKAHTDNLVAISIRGKPKHADAPTYVGLSRTAANELAMSEDLSFRVIWEDGVEHLDSDELNLQRVSVYVLDDRVIRAEYY